MKKEDLKCGNVVELECIGMYLICGFGLNTILCRLDGKHYLQINDINDTYIIKVYEDYTLQNLLWERKEKPVLTEDEKVILRNLPKEYKWIARDKNSLLHIYSRKPLKDNVMWKYVDIYEILIAFNHLFQFIKWEDEEPYLISDLLKECEE